MEEDLSQYRVMSFETIKKMTPEEFRIYYADKQTEEDIAEAYEVASRADAWFYDIIYDYAEGTPEHLSAVEISNEWSDLYDEWQEKIFNILRSEGVVIPKSGQISVLTPFMERNGYYNSGGWWIKEKK
jgi:hypothetical protein